jgi:hypothetical protein
MGETGLNNELKKRGKYDDLLQRSAAGVSLHGLRCAANFY